MAIPHVIIGVSGVHLRSRSVRAMMKMLRDNGATVVFLDNHIHPLEAAVKRDMAWIDALIVMGNDLDIDPKSYLLRYAPDDPKRAVHPKTRSESATAQGKMRARHEDLMIRKALAAGMPVLGICGGMQRINVICGGTLHQHIPDLVGCNKHMQQTRGIAPHIPVMPVIIKENTTLAAIACNIQMPFVKGREKNCPIVIMENAMHHQAVDRVGSDLRVCAVTDTIRMRSGAAGFMVQAIESDPEGKYGRQFILGVQWHAEFAASSLAESLIRGLIDHGRKFNVKSLKSRHKSKKR